MLPTWLSADLREPSPASKPLLSCLCSLKRFLGLPPPISRCLHLQQPCQRLYVTEWLIEGALAEHRLAWMICDADSWQEVSEDSGCLIADLWSCWRHDYGAETSARHQILLPACCPTACLLLRPSHSRFPGTPSTLFVLLWCLFAKAQTGRVSVM